MPSGGVSLLSEARDALHRRTRRAVRAVFHLAAARFRTARRRDHPDRRELRRPFESRNRQHETFVRGFHEVPRQALVGEWGVNRRRLYPAAGLRSAAEEPTVPSLPQNVDWLDSNDFNQVDIERKVFPSKRMICIQFYFLIR